MAVSPRSGLRDWLGQRVTAVIMVVYLTAFAITLVQQPVITFERWHTLFSCNWVRYGTLFMLAALAWHAWIGLWTIATDYLKHIGVRLVFLWSVAGALFAYLLWAIEILWGVI